MAAHARVFRVLHQADAVVVAHGHGDHLSGALKSAHLARPGPRLFPTRERLASPQAPPRPDGEPAWPAGAPRPRPPEYE